VPVFNEYLVELNSPGKYYSNYEKLNLIEICPSVSEPKRTNGVDFCIMH